MRYCHSRIFRKPNGKKQGVYILTLEVTDFDIDRMMYIEPETDTDKKLVSAFRRIRTECID